MNATRKRRLDLTTLRHDAALALDFTHSLGERGPKTYAARQRLAVWLDTDQGSLTQVEADIAWLKKVGKGWEQ